MRLFYRDDVGYDHDCFPLDVFKDQLFDELHNNPEAKMILHSTKKSSIAARYCSEVMDFPSKGDCGAFCSEYSPCNGEKGKCRYLLFGLIADGKVYELSKNGLEKCSKIFRGI